MGECVQHFLLHVSRVTSLQQGSDFPGSADGQRSQHHTAGPGLVTGLGVAEEPHINMTELHQELSITAEVMFPPASL